MVKKITLDPHQTIIAKKLQQLAHQLEKEASQNFFQKFFLQKKRKKTHYRSLYIYGDVGRGKSMLVKNFFSSLKKTKKVHFHFNNFMRAIHESLYKIRKSEKIFKDELIESTRSIVKENRLIYLDEFQVLDIADAMILGRVFSYLFSQGISIVFTSNLHPQELYKNGLQREIFLEFINHTLLKHCKVLHLNSSIDYRSINIQKDFSKRYFISNETSSLEIKKIIESLTINNKAKTLNLLVWGRKVEIKKTFGKIAIFNFSELFQDNLSSSDYQIICQNFDLIFLLQIPKFNAEDINEAKRFMLFIDELYEQKLSLIIEAQTEPAQLLSKNKTIEDFFYSFQRTISRLNEINSDKYWLDSKFAKNKQ